MDSRCGPRAAGRVTIDAKRRVRDAFWDLEIELNSGERVTLPKSAPGVDVARDIATKELGGFSCAFAKMKIGRGS